MRALFISLRSLRGLQALEVTPNSGCSALCLDHPHDDAGNKTMSSTQTFDLVCNDWELAGVNSTIKGRKFKECLTCESKSTSFDANSTENYVYWFLCNILCCFI